MNADDNYLRLKNEMTRILIDFYFPIQERARQLLQEAIALAYAQGKKDAAEEIFKELEKNLNPLNIIKSDYRAYLKIKERFIP